MRTGHPSSKVDQQVKISAVIVNHNTKRLLQQCIQSIYDTADELSLEIFVVDNASSDGSQDMIRTNFPQIKLIANSEGLGFSRAANMALAEAKGNYFLISHPDVKYLPGTIQEMYSFLRTHSQVGIVGGNLLYPDGSYNPCSISKRSVRRELLEFSASFKSLFRKFPWLGERIKKARSSLFWDHQADAESPLVWNASMMFKREVVESVGNFCEDFFVWFADADLCYRARNAGWKIYYLQNAKVIHYEKQSRDYLDSELVAWKVDWNETVERMIDKDQQMLFKRHYSPLFLWFRKSINVARMWTRYAKWTIRRIFTSSKPAIN